MTTYTLRAVTVTEGSTGANAVVAENVMVRVSDDYLMKYSLLGSTGSGNLREVDLSAGRGTDYQFSFGGVRPDTGWVAQVGEITWGGHKSQVMVLAHSGPVEKWSLIQLSGDPLLSSMTTVSKVNAFFDSITSINGKLSGTFAAGNAFSMRDVLSFASATENDRIIANGRYDDWAGQTIATGVGNDFVNGVSAADKFDLGSGNDTGIGGSSSDTILGGTGNDSLLGESGGDLLRGGAGADYGFGGTGIDKIYGDAGKDQLDGGHDADSLYGGVGNDSLMGGTGNDLLAGGDGADTFRFRAGDDADRIADFQDGLDTLVLSGISGVGSATQALSHATAIAGGVQFDFGDGDVLTVMGVTKTTIADQIFVL